MDLIWFYNQKHKTGPAITYNQYASEIGFTPDNVQTVIASLKSKQMLAMHPVQKRIVTTSLWNTMFDEDAQFKELWQAHPKGNKESARLNFLKVNKMIAFNSLLQKLQDYVASKDDPTYLTDLSGWLNPKLKRWEDPIEYKGGQNTSDDTSTPRNLFT